MTLFLFFSYNITMKSRFDKIAEETLACIPMPNTQCQDCACAEVWGIPVPRKLSEKYEEKLIKEAERLYK